MPEWFPDSQCLADITPPRLLWIKSFPNKKWNKIQKAYEKAREFDSEKLNSICLDDWIISTIFEVIDQGGEESGITDD